MNALHIMAVLRLWVTTGTLHVALEAAHTSTLGLQLHGVQAAAYVRQAARAGLLGAWRAAVAAGQPVPDAVAAALALVHSYLLAPRLARLGDHEARHWMQGHNFLHAYVNAGSHLILLPAGSAVLNFLVLGADIFNHTVW